MKIFIVLSTLFVASFALDKDFIEKIMEEIRSVGEKCVGETNASKDDIASLLAHKVPESHEGKCMIFCFHKHYNIQNEDGSLNMAGAIGALEPLKQNDMEVYGQVVKIFQTCGNTPSDADPCIFATSLAQCAIKEAKAAGLTDLIILE